MLVAQLISSDVSLLMVAVREDGNGREFYGDELWQVLDNDDLETSP